MLTVNLILKTNLLFTSRTRMVGRDRNARFRHHDSVHIDHRIHRALLGLLLCGQVPRVERLSSVHLLALPTAGPVGDRGHCSGAVDVLARVVPAIPSVASMRPGVSDIAS